VAQFLLEKHNIEMARGLGPLLGKVWRVGNEQTFCSHHCFKHMQLGLTSNNPITKGLMGYNARASNVKHFLSALHDAINNLSKL